MKTPNKTTLKNLLRSALPSAIAVPALVLALALTTASVASAGTYMWSNPFSFGNWAGVPVTSGIIPQGTATLGFDVKDIRVCNDSNNLYFMVELWPSSTNTDLDDEGHGGTNPDVGVKLNFWLDTDNNPNTGYLNADQTGVGADMALQTWEEWTENLNQCNAGGATGANSLNANLQGPAPSGANNWSYRMGIRYVYAVSLAATNLDGTACFPSNSIAIGLTVYSAGGVFDTAVPSFSYTLAPTPANPPGIDSAYAALTLNPNGTAWNNWAAWTNVPVAAWQLEGTATAGFDVKDIRVANDDTNLYFLLELWPSSTNANIYNMEFTRFFLDTDDNPNTGYADASGVGSDCLLHFYQVWGGCWPQFPNDFGPDNNDNCLNANPVAYQPPAATTTYQYEFAMARAATYTNGSPVFTTNVITIGFGLWDTNFVREDTIGGFPYRFATKSVATQPGNPTLARVSGGSFSFSVTNSGGTYVVQANNNLANAAGWMPIYTNTAPFTFTDSSPAGSNKQRFYRTVSQ